jgi:hypothetical protein
MRINPKGRIMKKLMFFMAVITLLMAVSAMPVAAASGPVAGHSAMLALATPKQEDHRVIKLRKYLEAYNSPLAPFAEDFIREADANHIDWKFVVSIAGVESGYGKHIPHRSYNGWGWGYRNGTVMHFTSWDEAIQTISHDLRMKYMDRGGARNIYDIGHVYAANPNWASRVQGFMNQLEAYEPVTDTLPISI